MIVAEPQEPNVVVVMRGGADQTTQTDSVTHAQPQVRPAAKKKVQIDVQEQKRIFMDVCPEFVDAE